MHFSLYIPKRPNFSNLLVSLKNTDYYKWFYLCEFKGNKFGTPLFSFSDRVHVWLLKEKGLEIQL